MADNKSFLETLATRDQPESFAEEKFQIVQNNGSRKKILVAAVIATILLIGAFSLYYAMSTVEVPELAGQSLDEAALWAQKNKITLVAKNVYSFEDEENKILSQEVEAGKSIKKNSTLQIKVSIGPDPEEVISFPDLETMTTPEIETWISDNKLTGTKLVTANSDVVEANHVISYSFTDGSEDNFKRKNRLTVNVSIGSATLAETVVVADFSAMKAAGVLQWGADNGVIITLLEEFDKYAAAGSVISQNVTKNTEIKRTDGLTVVISKGKPVTVPSFASMTKEEANAWAKLNNVNLTILERYSETVSKGKFFSQSVTSGASIREGDAVSLYCSLGKVDVASFIGKTKLEFINWQDEVNGKDANIRLSFTEAYGAKGSAGKIISQSVKNEYVTPGADIKVVISKGMRIAVPDFNGKTESECNTIANSSGLSILFDYRYSDTVSKGYVISQSPARNTVITDSDTVTIVISMTDALADKVVVADFAAMKAAAILQWGMENGVSVKLTEVYDNFVPSGSVVSQSIPKNTVINKTVSIVVAISAGKAPAEAPSSVPNFSIMTKEEANSWAKLNNVSLNFMEKYSNSYRKGTLFNQSATTGSSINVGSTISIYYSLGKVEIGNFATGNKTKLDVLSWQSTVNEKGGNITVEFNNKAGVIWDQAVIIDGVVTPIRNDLIDVGSTVVFTLSA